MALAPEAAYRDPNYYRRDIYPYAVPEAGFRSAVKAEHIPRNDKQENLLFSSYGTNIGAAIASIAPNDHNKLLLSSINTATVENFGFCLEAAVRDIGIDYEELSTIQGPFVTDPSYVDVAEQAACELANSWTRHYVIAERGGFHPSGGGYTDNLYLVKKKLQKPGVSVAIEFIRSTN